MTTPDGSSRLIPALWRPYSCAASKRYAEGIIVKSWSRAGHCHQSKGWSRMTAADLPVAALWRPYSCAASQRNAEGIIVKSWSRAGHAVARRARKNARETQSLIKLCGLGVNHEIHPAGRPLVPWDRQSKIHPTPFTFLVWADIHKTASGRALLDILASLSLFVICCDDRDVCGFERLSVSSL